MSVSPASPLDPYHTGPGGFFLDRNGDGHPDDLAVRIVLPPDPERLGARFWCALIDLGGRLGLETTGLPDRLVLTAGEPVSPDIVVVAVDPDRVDPALGDRRLILRSPEDARTLALAGVTLTGTGSAPPNRAGEIADLSAIFARSGLLRDRDGDCLLDSTRCILIVPEPCPPAIGIAAIEFAARLGLESGGIDLPLAVCAGDEIPPGAIAIDLRPTEAALPAGSGRLRLADGRVHLAGDQTGVAALLTFLATTWPALSPAAAPINEARRIAAALGDLATAATPLGRIAHLVASVAPHPSPAAVRLLSGDADEGHLARLAFDGRGVGMEERPAWDEVFTLDWNEPWEVDRARKLLTDDLLPLVKDQTGPLEVLVLVSEPPEIRRDLEREIAVMIADAAVRVRVRSAYKAGLSWIREDVIPALRHLPGIDRIEFRFAPPPGQSDAAPPRLDLPIRWLQELYPGDELLAGALNLPLDAIDLIERSPDDGSVYEAVAFRDGAVAWRQTFSPRWYEFPYLAPDPERGTVLVSTGGVRVTRGDAVLLDRELPTDCDRFWAWYRETVLPRVGQHLREVTDGAPRLTDQPVFAALQIDAWISEPNEPLGIREEIDSAAEALHEDIYFGSLDWLAAFSRSLGGDELTGPGAILPFIHVRPGRGPSARVTLRARRRFVGEIVAADGSVHAVAPVAILPRPNVAVTGLTVGPTGLTALDVTLAFPPETDAAPVRVLLDAAAKIAAAETRAGECIAVIVQMDGADPIAITIPLFGADLNGVTPATEAAVAGRILFGSDLPPLLARLAARPGAHAWRCGESLQGRPLWAVEVTAPMPTRRWSPAKLSLRKPTLLIVGRHHANEVASTTAAFLLAELLTADPSWRPLRDALNVIMLPFANPDGAALHETLVAEHPTWKHHAARYNAAGLETAQHFFDEQTPFGEARVRRELWERWLPDVIVDNHGVPSHEWSQQFAGFGSPPRFPVCYWMVQALLYGIIHHVDAPEQSAFARELRRRLAAALKADGELDDLNRTYGHRYQRWGTSRVPHRFPADVEDDFLCYVTAVAPDPNARNFGIRFPATTTLDWVTEVPDETVHGAQLARTARAHLLADEAVMRLMVDMAPPVERGAVRDEDGTVALRLRRRRPLS